MTKANITQYDSTPSNNADINDINIAENCPASNINNAIRELMAHLKNVDTGSQALTALSVTGNVTVAGNIQKTSGDLTLDVEGDIILDANGGDVNFQDDGTVFGFMAKSSNDLLVGNAISDGDVLIRGSDGGSNITALKLDMSVGGFATLANGLDLTDGNISVASGHGIDFGATSSTGGGRTMTSELLDDYEEGTFTPSLIDSADGLGANLTTAVGQYTKVGNKVHFQLRINGDARTSTGNQVFITNLPFTCSPASSVNRAQFEINGINLGLDSNFFSLIGQLANTDTSLTILMQGTSLDNFRGHDLTPSYEIYVHGSYFTS